MNKIRILLADDQTMIRQGISYILRLQPDMEVVGEASNGQEAVSIAIQSKPDIILMDVQMPNINGIEATKEILAALPDTRIIILTTFDVYEYVMDGIKAGALGYMLKDADAEDMIKTIRNVVEGQAIFQTGEASRALTDLRNLDSIQQVEEVFVLSERLTEREFEVLQQMAYGLRNDTIAQELFISEGTVKTHVHRILQKLGVEDRTQAVVLAIRQKLVK